MTACVTCGASVAVARPPKNQGRACSYWCELAARGIPGFAPEGQLAFDLEVLA